jgi:hypothetical protein
MCTACARHTYALCLPSVDTVHGHVHAVGAVGAAQLAPQLVSSILHVYRRSCIPQVLWEQDLWNDVAKSLELNRRVFPWAVGYGKKSDMWATLGYRRRPVAGTGRAAVEATHQLKRVAWRTSNTRCHHTCHRLQPQAATTLMRGCMRGCNHR